MLPRGCTCCAVVPSLVQARLYVKDVTYVARLPDGQLGEAWDSRASPIQLVGFVLGLVGTLVYAQGTTRRDTQLPCLLPTECPKLQAARHVLARSPTKVELLEHCQLVFLTFLCPMQDDELL